MALRRWKKALKLGKHQAAYEHLFSQVDGFALSRQARSEHDALEYIYGEIDFISFIALLSLTKPDHTTVFYDLGSGTGKAVLACAMVFKVRESHGIELFASLHNAASQQQQSLSCLSDYTETAKTVHFTHGSFLHADLSKATLIFINATGFFGATWDAISQRLEQSTCDLTVITTSKRLNSTSFSIIKITPIQMSWGIVNAYIQRRTNTS